MNCPSDCRGKQNGNPNKRYCCSGDGAGGGETPVDCNDARCNESGFQCGSADPYCCGDTICTGIEDGFNCEIDCGAPPVCGDTFCDPGEDQCNCVADCGAPSSEDCANGIDDDCDGLTDCNDSDCSGDPACSCGGNRSTCTSNSQCCSNNCKSGTCRGN